MSKSSLITVLALIASVSAKPYLNGALPFAPRAALAAPEFYNPALAPLPTSYSSVYSTAISAPLLAQYAASLAAPYTAPLAAPYATSLAAAYPARISAAYPAPAPAEYAIAAPVPAISAFDSPYNVEGLAALVNAAAVYGAPLNYFK